MSKAHTTTNYHLRGVTPKIRLNMQNDTQDVTLSILAEGIDIVLFLNQFQLQALIGALPTLVATVALDNCELDNGTECVHGVYHFVSSRIAESRLS